MKHGLNKSWMKSDEILGIAFREGLKKSKVVFVPPFSRHNFIEDNGLKTERRSTVYFLAIEVTDWRNVWVFTNQKRYRQTVDGHQQTQLCVVKCDILKQTFRMKCIVDHLRIDQGHIQRTALKIGQVIGIVIRGYRTAGQVSISLVNCSADGLAGKMRKRPCFACTQQELERVTIVRLNQRTTQNERQTRQHLESNLSSKA